MIPPRLQYSILCDEVVAKPDGKMVFWGVFGGLSALSFPATHPRMFCATGWIGGSGEFHETVQLFSPDRTVSVVELHQPINAPGIFASTTNVYDLRGITFPEPGIYWVVVKLGQQVVLEYPLNVVLVTPGAAAALPADDGGTTPPAPPTGGPGPGA
jgi:hypothetical protein